jgi:membrane associated rhomboid family serine protease|uniref:rhomboid family intramembrane serine protease n=1 Tax=Cephaloticoccus sp. TaxID=1985742 RepID=UPI00404B82DB
MECVIEPCFAYRTYEALAKEGASQGPFTALRDCERPPNGNAGRMNRLSRAVTILLFINVVLFVAGALLPQKGDQLVAMGALWYPTNEHFGVWQIVTYMFLHGGIGHIFFNMFALVSFGKILELEWGSARFVTFYFLCGVGAALIQTGINWYEFQELHARLVAAGMTPAGINTLFTTGRGDLPADPAVQAVLVDLYGIYATPTIGASGAIYGLLVAFGFLHPNAKLALMFVPVPVAAKYFIPGLLLLDLFSGVTGFSLFGGNIAHFAHLGGAVIGFLLMLLWRKRSQGPTWTDGEFRMN